MWGAIVKAVVENGGEHQIPSEANSETRPDGLLTRPEPSPFVAYFWKLEGKKGFVLETSYGEFRINWLDKPNTYKTYAYGLMDADQIGKDAAVARLVEFIKAN